MIQKKITVYSTGKIRTGTFGIAEKSKAANSAATACVVFSTRIRTWFSRHKKTSHTYLIVPVASRQHCFIGNSVASCTMSALIRERSTSRLINYVIEKEEKCSSNVNLLTGKQLELAQTDIGVKCLPQ